MQTLLLTGGTGYIGSHAAVVFLQQGYNIIIIDNLSNSSDSVVEKINTIVDIPLPNKESKRGKLKFYKGDLKNKSDIEKIFSENSIDGVIHFAGSKAVGESCNKPFNYYENNVTTTGNLLEIMDNHGCKDIIFSSSATVYDPSGIPPFSEDSKTGGNIPNPYGTNKYVIEHMLRDMSNHREFHSVCLRYFNPVGAHSSGLIGENPHDIPDNLLPFIMKVASGELNKVDVFGDDYDTPDGTGVRDYIHVVDLVEGHLKAWEFIKSNSNDGFIEYINLGTSNGTSVLEMIKYASNVVGRPLPYSIAKRRIGDLASSYCIVEKAKKMLNWEAKIPVRQAIADSWNFIQKKK